MPLNQSHSSNLEQTRRLRRRGLQLALLGIAYLSFVLGSCFLGGASLIYSLHQAQIRQWQAAERSAGVAKTSFHLAHQLTFHQLVDIELLREFSKVLQAGSRLANPAEVALSTFHQTQTFPAQDVLPALEHFDQAFGQLHYKLADYQSKPRPRSMLIAQLSPDQIRQLENLHDVVQLLTKWLSTPGDVVILLQNAEELRATGGFMGTYARVRFDGQKLHQPLIRDIYDPAGLTTQVPPAPTAVSQFLTAGAGLTLPNANWEADFPSSAQTILELFEVSGEPDISGVIAINTRLVEAVLKELGPIYLPSRDEALTAKTLTQVLRADRADFFPGSHQKTESIESVTAALKLRLEQLTPTELARVPQLWHEAVKQQQVLSVHQNSQVQAAITEAELSGQIPPSNFKPGEILIYPVESNVGINKANQGVYRRYELVYETRSLDAEKTTKSPPGSLQVSISFQNTNRSSSVEKVPNPYLATADHLHYVNYQRLIISPELEVVQIKQTRAGGVTTEPEWTDTELITKNGRPLREIGWLVSVLESETTTVTVSLQPTGYLSSPLTVNFPFQPGLSPTTLTQVKAGEPIQHPFESDLKLEFNH